MKLLQDRILSDGKYLGNGILKVDSFMNHQIDPILMKAVGEEFARLFEEVKPSKILTAESSGIAPALATGMSLKLPIVFARKNKPVTMAGADFRETATSHTKGGEVDLVVADVSFISLTKVLSALPSFLAPAADVVALIKPQFEVGREAVGKGGIVRDPAARRRAQEIVEAAARELGFVVRGVCDSPIRGQKGNLELLIWLTAQPR